MKYVLFLDDEPARQEKFRARSDMQDAKIVFVTNPPQAIAAITTIVFDEVWLDHDLGSGWGTGHDVAVFIAGMAQDKRPQKVVLHTMNPVGRERMGAVLRDAGVRAMKCVV